jgi:hemolysin activation/secretion protein
LQRSLIVLKETPGVLIKSSIEPGENDGDLALKLELSDDDVDSEHVEINNYGSRVTGANQAVAAIRLSNPSGFGDQVDLSVISSVGAQFGQAAYSVPLGYDGWRAGIGITDLHYTSVSNYKQPNGGYGDAWTANPNLSYPLYRSDDSNMDVTLGYTVAYFSNYNINGNASSGAYNTNAFSAGISGNAADEFFGGGTSTAAFTLKNGTLSISQTSPTGYGQYTPTNFNKFNFTLSRNQQLSEDSNNAATLTVNGQLSSVNLNGSEQFYLGGPQAVRAYPVAQSGGAQGGVASLDLIHKFWNDYQISAFFDYGLVQQFRSNFAIQQGLTNANNTYSLKGTGIGAQWSSDGWVLKGMVAWAVGKNPLYNSNGQAVNVDSTTTNPLGWFSAAYNF